MKRQSATKPNKSKKHQERLSGARHLIIPDDIVEYANSLLICRDLFPTAAGYFKFAKGHYISREAGAPEHIVICCVAGSGICEIAGKSWPIKANEFAFLPVNTPHHYEASIDSPWTIMWFHYTGRLCHEYHDLLGVSDSNPLLRVSNIGRLVSGFEEVFDHTQSGFTRRSLFCLSTSFSYFLSLCSLNKRARSAPRRKTEEKIRESVRFMKSEMKRTIRLSDLADVAGLTDTYYSQVFKREMDASPIDFLREIRLQEACSELKLTARTIAEIARSVGYSDPFYFSKVFRKRHKISPSGYRKKFQLANG